MKKINQAILTSLLLVSSIVYLGCSSSNNNNNPLPAPVSCTDGIQNQGETGVDCGGPCPACITCSDGIQNQGETGVDCGGPCPACATSSFTATLDGSPFVGIPNATLFNNPNPGFSNTLSIGGSRPSVPDGISLAIEFFGSPAVGVYNYSSTPTTPALASAGYTSQATNDCLVESGTVTLTQVNLTTKKISGTFSFTCRSFSNPSITHTATNGVFTNISYN